MIGCYLYFFFFFQAEDGIRDVAVTGVQTCALPISSFGNSTRYSRTAPSASKGLSDADSCRRNCERSEEHTSELQSRLHLVCRLLLEKKKKSNTIVTNRCHYNITKC